MTLVEMARCLGVETVDELVESCGFAPEDRGVVVAALEAEMVRPCLVLDFRGGVDARTRWQKYEKGPLPPGKIGRLDPRTGLKVAAARGRKK